MVKWTLPLLLLGLATPAWASAEVSESASQFLEAKRLARNAQWLQAFHAYHLAARAGSVAATVDIATYYLRGLGSIPSNPSKAEQLLIDTAEQGDPRACRILGALYESNRYGLATDPAKAQHYRQLSDHYYAHNLGDSLIAGY